MLGASNLESSTVCKSRPELERTCPGALQFVCGCRLEAVGLSVNMLSF